MEVLHKQLVKIFYLSRSHKQLLMIAFDVCAVCISALFSQWVLASPTFTPLTLLLTMIIALAFNAIFGLYTSIIRHLGLKILFIAACSAILSGFVLAISSDFILGGSLSFREAIVFALAFYVLISGARLLVRSYYLYRHGSLKENVVIYGAGAAGQQLAASLVKGNEFNPVLYIDDDKGLHGTYIGDIKVYSVKELASLINQYKTQKVFLALPTVSRRRRQKIISKLEKFRIEVKSIPGLADIISGKMEIDQVQDVSIDDLLGRDSVSPMKELLSADISNKVVMVTGAGGSIGSELCRQIFRENPKALILFEQSEYSLYAIDKELNHFKNDSRSRVELIPVLGSIQNIGRVDSVLNKFSVDTIYHAAAYKHVPLVEYNTIEGIENNIFGTRALAEAAIDNEVSTFVLISTDKAVRPTNVMGATKRFAELVLQALATTESKTRFCMVRFGNVLGSSGSVVPLFKQQIKNGGPVTVTHKDITRYFMTIPEAAQLVIQAGAMGKGGDVFVLDMGKSIKIADLAKKMIRLMGLEVRSESNPDGDIDIAYTGLRPGEKLYEELLIGTNVSGTDHPRIMTADEVHLPKEELDKRLSDLIIACSNNNFDLIRSLLIDAPTGYTPSSEICDHLSNVSKSKDINPSNIINLNILRES